MTRKAILIGSPTPPPYLKGVKQDIKNMKNLLTSANGGSWKDGTEIITMPFDPNFSDLELHLNSLQYCDFAFVYYSGHGYTDNGENPRINLNANETPLVSQLANRCKRQITIVDACRGYRMQSGFDGIPTAISGVEEITFDNYYPQDARLIFDTYLQNCADGKVLLFASQHAQNADDTENGGYFSTNLLYSTKDLAKSIDKPVINIYDAFKEAYELTQNKHQPDIIRTDEGLKLPFAIKSKATIQKNNSQDSGQSGVTAEDIAKFALATIAVVGITVFVASILGGNKQK